MQVKRYGKAKPSNRDSRAMVVQDDHIKLPLGVGGKDGYTLLDKEFAYLAEENWSINHYGYVRNSRTKQLLHRIVTNCPEDKVVDHIDGNKLNNRAKNLRVCTQAENSRNRIGLSYRKKYKGVVAHKNGSFRAEIKYNYKCIHLGYFKNAVDAAKAYDQAAQKYFKEFARLNHV